VSPGIHQADRYGSLACVGSNRRASLGFNCLGSGLNLGRAVESASRPEVWFRDLKGFCLPLRLVKSLLPYFLWPSPVRGP
jgi:hypothetical protein